MTVVQRKSVKSGVGKRFSRGEGHFAPSAAGKWLDEKYPYVVRRGLDVLQRGSITRGGWLTLLTLQDLADDDGCAVLHSSRLAQKPREISRATVYRRLPELLHAGLAELTTPRQNWRVYRLAVIPTDRVTVDFALILEERPDVVPAPAEEEEAEPLLRYGTK